MRVALVLPFIVAACETPTQRAPIATVPIEHRADARTDSDQNAGSASAIPGPTDIDWPAADKKALDATMAAHVAIVAHDGKAARLLPDCFSTGVAYDKKKGALEANVGELPKKKLKGECKGATHFVKRAVGSKLSLVPIAQ